MTRRKLFLVGFLLLALPFVIQFFERINQENIVSTFWEELETMEASELEESMLYAKAYNEELYQSTKVLAKEEVVDEALMEKYKKALWMSEEGIMGTIEIPKISLRLPIYHGTTDEVLSKGIGHLDDSSLPVGGENVHCILTGHRGLPNAQLFTRLDEVEKEDIFYVRVCDEVLAYRVKEIQVVKPEEVEVLEIQSEKDRISLITCTPYGLNTHRLVVTGERELELNMEEIEEIQEEVNWISKREIVIVLILILFLAAAVWKWRKSLMVAVMVLILCFPLNTMAAEGSVEIAFSDAQQKSVRYVKVGDLENETFVLKDKYHKSGIDLNELKTAVERKEAANVLHAMTVRSECELVKGKRKVNISGLEEGVYLFHFAGSGSYEPVLIYVPTWSESEAFMSYHIKVIPKILENTETILTGWEDFSECYCLLLFGSLIIIMRAAKVTRGHKFF